MNREVHKALESGNVSDFIKQVYDLGQDETQSLKEEVVTRIAHRAPSVVTQLDLDVIQLSGPLFGCALIKAMKGKDESRKATIAILQEVVDSQERVIAGYKAIVAKHKVGIEEQTAQKFSAERGSKSGRLLNCQKRKEMNYCILLRSTTWNTALQELVVLSSAPGQQGVHVNGTASKVFLANAEVDVLTEEVLQL